jgi:carbamoyltransferase
MFNVVGLSAYYHNSACCLLRDGRLIAAAEEERFTRRKHDPTLPVQAFRYCLREAGLSVSDVDCVAYYEDPALKLGRQLWSLLPALARATHLPTADLDATRPEREIRERLGYDGPIVFTRHHHAHAASAFHFSGFPEAAVMTVDGVGEWATMTYSIGTPDGLEEFEQVEFPSSLGLLYSAVTSYLGFEVNEGEYKVMGLAPYGTPRYRDRLREMIASLSGGGFRLDPSYFDFVQEDRMYSDEFIEALGQPPRPRGAPVTQFHQDVASSLQAVLEDVLIEKANYLHTRTGSDHLCLAGGVALNCVANSAILRRSPFRSLFVQPAANDAGACLGAAALAHVRSGRAWPRQRMEHCYLGPGYTSAEIRALLGATGLRAEDFASREEALASAVAERLAKGEVVGWFQGRMEFGPRALGARSILADPRDPGMRDRINALVKRRESFRPFAPAVLDAHAAAHFALDHPSPFMLETCQVISPLSLPSITHVDGSARVQTVDEHALPRYAGLLRAFDARTGCPVLLNTSFNMKDEPIVCTPIDALLCFVRSGLDCLVLEDHVIDRQTLPPHWLALADRWRHTGPSAITHRVYTFV